MTARWRAGNDGPGRMAEPMEIVAAIEQALAITEVRWLVCAPW